jgi:hypothetical protein
MRRTSAFPAGVSLGWTAHLPDALLQFHKEARVRLHRGELFETLAAGVEVGGESGRRSGLQHTGHVLSRSYCGAATEGTRAAAMPRPRQGTGRELVPIRLRMEQFDPFGEAFAAAPQLRQEQFAEIVRDSGEGRVCRRGQRRQFAHRPEISQRLRHRFA